MRTTRYNRLLGSTRRNNAAARIQRGSGLAATTSSRRALSVVADLSAKGRAILPKSITVQRIMGEGSFGQVFEGNLSTPAGSQRVVLKRVKTRVQGAEAMSQMEHLLNVYASRVARGHCADFLGYCEVADSEATVRLTAGLWLVWKYEGSKTVSYYLRQRDTLRLLAKDLEVPEAAAVPTVMKQIFEGLAAFHAAGLVHRDIKPLNIIFAEDVKRFKLIDLGACADLRSGTNYVPEESILDLHYCPPEQYVLPTDSPHIARQAGLLKLAISPMLWAKHKPDRFDTWSAGVVMLQLAVPSMRTDRALRAFNAAYGPKHSYDLAAWRRATNLGARDCMLLDAFDGAGWELLQSLLAPRHIQVDDNGGVSFVNDSPFPRVSAFEALKHRFIRYGLEAAAVAAAAAPAQQQQPPPAARSSTAAAPPTSGSTPNGSAARSSPVLNIAAAWPFGKPAAAAAAPAGSGGSSGGAAAAATGSGGSPQAAAGVGPSGGMGPSVGAGGGNTQPPGDALASAMGAWRDMTDRLFDLEFKIMRQASATQLQTTTVKRLRDQVDSGKADPAVLQKEERVLNKMQTRLAGLQQDFTSAAAQASGVFSFFGLGRKPPPPQLQQQQQQQQPQPQPPQQQRGDTAPAAAIGLFWGAADRGRSNLQALRAAEAASAAAVSAAASSNAAGSSSPPPSVSAASSSAAGMFSSLWERLGGRLRELEAKISNQASATERQSLVVKGLRAKVDAGEAEPELLERAELMLRRMEGRLTALDRDFRAAKESAVKALAGNVPTDLVAPNSGGGSSSSGRPQQQSAATTAAGQQRSEGDASFWFRLMGGSGGGSGKGSLSSPALEAAAKLQADPQQPGLPGKQPQQQQLASGLLRSSAQFARSLSPFRQPQQDQQPGDPPQAPPQQQQQQLGYRSIFGSFGAAAGSASSGSSGPRSSSDPTAPPSTPASPGASKAPNTWRAVSPRGPHAAGDAGGNAGGDGKSGGGLFSNLFSARSLDQPPAASGGGGASAGAVLNYGTATAAAPGLRVPPPAVAAAASSGDALVEGASRVIRSSLGFTGLAARVAGDLALALKADAERYLKDIEEREAAKRQQRIVDLAFMSLLREAQPPLTGATTYEATQGRLAGEPRWAALLDEGRRRQLYGSYMEAVMRMEEQAREAAEASFKAALRRYVVTPSSSWSEVQAAIPESDAMLVEVQDVERRQQLFQEVASELRLQEALREAARKAESEFRALLGELRDPPVTSTSTWSLVRRAVAADPRCQALPESRRRELFEAFTAELFEAEASWADAAVAAAEAAEDEDTANAAGAHLSSADPTTAAVQESTTHGSAGVPTTPDEPLPTLSSSPSSPAPAMPLGAPMSDPMEAPAAAAAAADPLLDDEDLAAALAGMEAALESALKAISSGPLLPPLPAIALDEHRQASSNADTNGSSRSAAVASAGSTNGDVQLRPPYTAGGSAAVVSGAAATAQPGGIAPAAATVVPLGGNGRVPSGGKGGVFDGSRLEELRKEQARLRAEYDAMSRRLREMEERLKSQAQLVASVARVDGAAGDDAGESAAAAAAPTPSPADALN